jgi:hypothetical protein
MTKSLLTHHLSVAARNCFLVPFAATAFAGASPDRTDPQQDQISTPTELQPSTTQQGLNFVVGAHGLDSLSFNGQSLLRSAQGGDLQPWRSIFREVLDVLFLPASSPIPAPAKRADTVDLSYPWGRVSCAYGKQGQKITMRIEVSNASAKKIDEFSLRLMELTFPRVPDGGTLEAGMFGFGFKGPEWPLFQYPASIPTAADTKFVVPIIRMDYGTGALNFCGDDLESSVDVPCWTDSPARTSYPLVVICRDIKSHASKTFNVSLRFGLGGASVHDLSGDILKGYASKYPFQVNWKDRRPIGAIFLAGPQINVTSNPRRWIMNSGEIDVTNDKGKSAFRAALLKLADNSVQILKDTDAQGMITWDPEGEEFLGACYYGNPRLVPSLAPEMEFKNNGAESVVDEYFAKFRAAGLKVGICIRPQQIVMVGGKPVQQLVDDEHALQILRERIAYAKQRWGCTLFYVDSTYCVDLTAPAGRSLYPDVFKAVAQTYPDVLLIPENESMRYFAYSAPLNSYQHHRVTSTPAGARMVYPKAFSVLMAADGDQSEDHAALLNAVGRGDILLFNCWYPSAGAEKIKKLYEEAKRPSGVSSR